jgi:chromate transporter
VTTSESKAPPPLPAQATPSTASTSAEHGALAPPPSLFKLASTFTRISVSAIGGGNNAWIRREMVERHRWLTNSDFLTGFAMCMVLPGATTINTTVFIGTKLRGAAGALAAMIGILWAPMVIVVLLGFVYADYGDKPAVARVLAGVSATAIALTLRMGVLSVYRRFVHLTDWLLTAAIVVVVFWLHWSIVETLLVFMPTSIAIAWWHYRPKPGRKLP